jgi:hypothetical protein
MAWSTDVIVSVLFPYLLPSFPVCKIECWVKEDIRLIFEKLLMFYCSIPAEKTRKLLETFVRRVLSTSSYKTDLDNDLYFLADIEERSSFINFKKWKSNVYSLYACTFLIKHKVDIHEGNDCALVFASIKGDKDVVALLLEHKANVHVDRGHALMWAIVYGYKDTVALLLEHNANVNADNDRALMWAIGYGHTDMVALLLEHKADFNVTRSMRY